MVREMRNAPRPQKRENSDANSRYAGEEEQERVWPDYWFSVLIILQRLVEVDEERSVL